MPMDINDLARGFVTGTVDDAGRRDARVSGRYAPVKIPARNGSVNAFETAAVRESDGTVMMLSRPGFGVESRFEEAIRGACEELDVPMIYDLTIEMTIGLSFAELRRGLDDGRARRGLDLFAARLVIETGGRTVADVFDGPCPRPNARSSIPKARTGSRRAGGRRRTANPPGATASRPRFGG